MSSILICSLFMFFGSALFQQFFYTPVENISITDKNNHQIADPSAVYCADAGYQYKQSGQIDVCVLSENMECGSWDFFNGKCGQEYTFCEKNGGKIIITNKNCKFSSECAACILQDGTECNEWDYFRRRCP